MIKEIRIGMDEIMKCPPSPGGDTNIMRILKDKGFPVQFSFVESDWVPRDGLKYLEFHDHKTGEIVIEWEDGL